MCCGNQLKVLWVGVDVVVPNCLVRMISGLLNKWKMNEVIQPVTPDVVNSNVECEKIKYVHDHDWRTASHAIPRHVHSNFVKTLWSFFRGGNASSCHSDSKNEGLP